MWTLLDFRNFAHHSRKGRMVKWDTFQVSFMSGYKEGRVKRSKCVKSPASRCNETWLILSLTIESRIGPRRFIPGLTRTRCNNEILVPNDLVQSRFIHIARCNARAHVWFIPLVYPFCLALFPVFVWSRFSPDGVSEKNWSTRERSFDQRVRPLWPKSHFMGRQLIYWIWMLDVLTRLVRHRGLILWTIILLLWW